jgi:RNA polymerase sigma-70 factor, ECF subfamily
VQRAAPFLRTFDLDLLRRRDRDAVAAEIEAHGEALERAAQRLGVTDLDDVMQSVWETFLEVLPRFEGRSKTRTFLHGILRRKAAEARRSTRAQPVDPHELDVSRAVPNEDAEKVVAAAELGAAIDGCLDALPATERRAIELKLIEQQDTPDVGRALGITANYLGVLLHRARAHLRHCLHAHVG